MTPAWILFGVFVFLKILLSVPLPAFKTPPKTDVELEAEAAYLEAFHVINESRR